MLIENKFSSKCRNCKQRIDIGETVDWVKGKGISHVECPEALQDDNSALIVIEDDERPIYGYEHFK